jgi:hypothetical protein
MKTIILVLLIAACASLSSARTFVVAADSAGDFLHVWQAADSAQPGDSIMIRDGHYVEMPFTVDSGMVVYAENPGGAELWMMNPDSCFILLRGTAKLVSLVIVGHYGGFGQTLVQIQGGPATLYNCLLHPEAHFGVQVALHSAGQAPLVRDCSFFAENGASPIVHNYDTTNVWMPYNYFGTQDTVWIHDIMINGGETAGQIYVSPVLDSFQWLTAEYPTPELPQRFSLACYPNPFNPTTTISFSLLRTGAVKLDVFDVMGRQVQILAEGRFERGEHQIFFDGSELPTGIYFARAMAGDIVRSEKMVLMR